MIEVLCRPGITLDYGKILDDFSFQLYNLAKFLKSYGPTDLKIRFGIKCCSRCTYPEVRTTENKKIGFAEPRLGF